MDKQLLFIVRAIESIGIQVSTIISDLGGSQTLWKELSISVTNSFFWSPTIQSRKIWVFADMPHYLKLLRKHFRNKGFKLNDGTIINANIIREVLEKDTGENKLCYKLKPQMLTLRGNERQKVAPAKILFSATTAKAVYHFTENKRVET